MNKKFVCSSTEPIVQTKAGKIRGYQLDSTYTFHGMKYANAKRFQMPSPVEPWEGVKDALSYGYIAPLMGPENPGGDLLVPHRYWPQSEDCQYLNVWTQSLDTAVKKPVMVWIHGGGFATGSSIEMIAYDGDNLSKYGDIVVVSINHRLNIFGYLDVSAYSDKYKNSANAGMADLVEALKWVKDNIAAFGGDPDNVTIFGQSGGGGKVQVLLQTPAADGLFAKAILMSGVIDFGPKPTAESAKILVGAIINELGIQPDEIEKLETVPYSELVKAYDKVAPALREKGLETGWAPTANDYYVGDGRFVGFTENAKKIPTLVGSCFGEFAFGPTPLQKDALPYQERKAAVVRKYGEHADTLISLFEKAYPNKNLIDLLSLDSAFRIPNLDFLVKKSACSEAATYSYLFAFDFPFNDGKPAWHCSEIPFVFRNTDKVAVCNVPGVTEKLQEQMSAAWVNFARTGNPSNAALPAWNAYKAGSETTMVIDTECEAKGDFDSELVALHKQASPFLFGRR